VEEKRAEFVAIAKALYAKSITITDSEQSKQSSQAEASASCLGLGKIGGTASQSQDDSAQASNRQEFGGEAWKTRRASAAIAFDWKDPQWFFLHSEPTWESMVKGRTGSNGSLGAIKCDFNYESDQKASARAMAGAHGIGLQAGGKKTQHQGVKQTFEVKFWQPTGQ
jgi:hypothetical protein